MASIEHPHFLLTAKGHTKVLATHPSTFEVTMESQLTPRGDCIIGICASHAANQVNELIGDTLRQTTSQIITYLSVDNITEQIQGWGSPLLTLDSLTSLVWRTSEYIDGRTISIRCNKAARDLNRNLIQSLQNPTAVLHIALVVILGET